MTKSSGQPGRQLFAVPMRRYTVFLDPATAEYYKERGGGNRSEGMRAVALAGQLAAPQSSREA